MAKVTWNGGRGPAYEAMHERMTRSGWPKSEAMAYVGALVLRDGLAWRELKAALGDPIVASNQDLMGGGERYDLPPFEGTPMEMDPVGIENIVKAMVRWSADEDIDKAVDRFYVVARSLASGLDDAAKHLGVRT